VSSVTKYVRDATRVYMADPTNCFNPRFAQVASSYSVPVITVDWTPASKQYFEAWLTPDDLDDSTPSKYPMVFNHGMGSDNTHDSLPRTFSGRVETGLAFWVTTKATDVRKATTELEYTLDAIEDVVNQMFTNGNWPQLYGAPNAICARIPAQRGRFEKGGEMSRQSILFRLTFQVDN